MPMTSSLRHTRNIICAMNQLAALFHDVGKNYFYFQDKLYRAVHNQPGSLSDPIRHEFLSFQIADCIFGGTHSELSDPLIHTQSVIKMMRNALSNEQSIKEFFNQFVDYPRVTMSIWKVSKSHFFSPVLHLILTHHKTPRNHTSAHLDYVNDEDIAQTNYAKIYSLFEEQSHIFHSQVLLEAILNQLIKIETMLTEYDNDGHADTPVHQLPHNTLMLMSHFFMRPSLILADQHFSKKQLLNERPSVYDTPFANTTYDGTEQAIFNQTLEEHLLGVAKLTHRVSRFLFNACYQNGFDALPAIDRSPKDLTKRVPHRLKNYYWQSVAQSKVEAITKDSPEAGFLGIVIAKTGAGKTFANLKLISASNLHEDYRVTCLLGMRSLTMQTYDEYKQIMGVSADKISGIIGSSLTEHLHGINTRGSFDADDDTSNVKAELKDNERLNVVSAATDLSSSQLPDFLQSKGRFAKTAEILRVPILVSTIDYMISGFTSPKSTMAKYLVRLMTSDIIIDEIDSYSEEQFVSIIRLISLVAMYGNNVIVSSATLTPLHVHKIREAYAFGVSQRSKIKSLKTSEYNFGLFTHDDALNEVGKSADIDVDAFFQNFDASTRNEPQKHYLAQLSLPTNNINSAYSCIMQRAIDLGQVHCSDIQSDDNTVLSYSAGLIKLVNIKHITPFAYHLLQGKLEFTVPEDTLLKFECYHSRHFDAYKSFQEKQFKQVLTRKQQNDLANTPCWQALKDEAMSLGKTKILLIVLASPIIDTGRDFDFDFAITEFRDHRGLIQTCGRVLRHRQLTELENRGVGRDNPNVFMLDRSLRYYDSRDPLVLYSKPGFQDIFNVNKDNDSRGELVEPLSLECVEKTCIELSEFSKGDAVNAAVMMQSHANCKAKQLELKSINAVCTDTSMALESVFSVRNFVSTKFTDQFPFRRNTDDKTTVFVIFDGQEIQQVAFQSTDKKTLPVTKMSRDFDIQTTAFANKSVLLTQLSLTEIMQHYQLEDGRLQTLEAPKYTRSSDIHQLPIFDTVLGFIDKYDS